MDSTQTSEITRFVRDTLGCKCPDAVFQSIAITHERAAKSGTAYGRLVVGDRVLIYTLDAERATKLSAAVSALAALGRAERDAGGLNRFRLVVATAHPTQVLADAQASFTNAPGHDDRTHLHVLASDQLPDALRSG